MNIVMLGANSDIAKELTARFMVDGEAVHAWRRGERLPQIPWKHVICTIGVLDPIGKFFDLDAKAWEENLDSNALLPLRLLRELWPLRQRGASVCFFSGAGVSRPAPTYSGYAASKTMLLKMTELLDDEYPEDKFFILGPGMVRTKIQQQTLDAGERADNYGRVKEFMESGDPIHGAGTSHDRIYACLKWCLKSPKEIIGGRNFYAPGLDWGPLMEHKLRTNRDLFKTRRFGGGL